MFIGFRRKNIVLPSKLVARKVVDGGPTKVETEGVALEAIISCDNGRSNSAGKSSSDVWDPVVAARRPLGMNEEPDARSPSAVLH